ncbi:MAG: hypothetical protein Q8P82_02385 [bacterium]|nr:hypothetical protein [bacterium]
MAKTLEEFLKRTRDDSVRNAVLCAVCSQPIREEDEDELVDGKPVHLDCFYDSLSDALEEFPIGSPGIRR